MQNNPDFIDNKRPDDSFKTSRKISKSELILTVLIAIALFTVIGGAFIVYSKVNSNNNITSY
ncbi:hypothetical protein CVV43_05220 [Candidatus Saccharibacteria bacterium HGW-Saccharibacteria-1]|nr:MAG: hypothetical protein CVV43_05220 [Candidatus Saccharibacteria bacterium HGW-Saccharibacteria-1]